MFNYLIETYKILNGNDCINTESFFYIDDMGFRGHDSMLFKRRFRLDVKKFVFSNRVIKLLEFSAYSICKL